MKGKQQMAKSIRIPLAGFALTTLALAAAAQSPSAQAALTRDYHIESQPLPAAVNDWADQAGLQVMWSAQMPGAQREAPEVAGRFSAPVALERVLQGSGLTFAFLDEQTVAIRLASAAGQPSAASRGGEVRASSSSQGEDMGEDQKQRLSRSEDSRQSVRGGDSSAASKAEVISEVVVTGSQIRGVVPQSSPLEIFTADDIRATGATTVEQFVQRLPQNHSSTFSSAPQSTGAFNPESASGIDLRGIGIGTTLVLINGRRMALAASGRSADISMIPLSAIDRVELLTDGASGIYGADAVGGVVNLVLKSGFQGAQTGLGYGGVTDGGLNELRAEQTFGGQWDSGSALISYNYLDRDSLDASERKFARLAAPYTLSPSDLRQSFLASGTQQVPFGVEVFGDALYSSRKTDSLTTHFAGASASKTDSDETQIFADLGARVALMDRLNAELVGSYSTLDTEYRDQGSFLGTNTSQDSEFEHTVVDVTAKLDGDLFVVYGGSAKFSVGIGYTTERYSQALIVDAIARPPLRLSRNTEYMFGEVFAPLVSPKNDLAFADRIELSLSARYTDYSEFGAQTSPKVGVLWAPVSSVMLRASYSESFRAPSLVQLNPAANDNVIFAPAAFGFPDPFSEDGTSVVLIPQGVGGERLGPEKAKTYTVGFDLRPLDELKISATYFKIKYRDRILAPFTFTEPFVTPADYSDVIYRNPSADLIGRVIEGSVNSFNMSGIDPTDVDALAGVITAIVDRRTRNLALSEVDGVDLSVAHRQQWSVTETSSGLQATYLLDYEQQNTVNAPVLQVYDTVLRPVGFRGRAYLGFDRGDISGQLNLNYVDDYKDSYAAVPTRVGSWTTLDASISYTFPEDVPAALNGVRLAVSVQNLLDRDPPSVGITANGAGINDPIGFDPSNADPLGRYVTLQLSKVW
jgi:iron complex outermembrane recepter protein